MPNTHTQQSLEQRHQELQLEISKTGRNIRQRWDVLFAPPKANTRVEAIVQNAQKAEAMYDGFMTAYKLIRRAGLIVSLLNGLRKKKRKK